jgi:hypothetical protein
MDEPIDAPIEAPNGDRVTFVNVYDYSRAYGGPEEGGWWYDTGVPVKSVACVTDSDVDVASTRLQGVYPSTGGASSVLGGEDYIILYESHPGRPFPEYRPHYE